MLKVVIKLTFFTLVLLSLASAQTQNTAPTQEAQEAARLNREAGRLFALQRYEEAVKTTLQELSLREKIGDEFNVGVAYFNLGTIYSEMKKYSIAIEHFQKALPIYRKKIGANNVRLLPLLTALGRLNLAKGDKTAAIEFFKNALVISESEYGADSAQTGELALEIAISYANLREAEEAESYFQRAILINDKLPAAAKQKADDRRDVSQYECFVYATNSDKFEERKAKFYKERRKSKTETGSDGDIEDDFINSKAVKLVRPAYPKEAIGLKKRVKIMLRITIDENGEVVNAESFCGIVPNYPLLYAAREAALQSKFTPTIFDGKPVKVTRKIVYYFN